VWAAAAVLLTLSLVWSPETALESARNGMNLFLNVVFLRPLFNVPGSANRSCSPGSKGSAAGLS